MFRYTTFLENQVERLQQRIEALETRNQELVLALVEKTPLSRPKVEPSHKMQKGESMAKCSCGWYVFENDPTKLQQEISSHYRQNIVPSSGSHRGSWQVARQKLEADAERNQDVVVS